MKTTVEITDSEKFEEVLATLKTLKADRLEFSPPLSITRGDKSLNVQDLFGIWKNKPRTLAEIRKKAWERS